MSSSQDPFIPPIAQPRQDTRVIDIHGHAGLPAVERLLAGRPETERSRQIMIESFGAEAARYNQEVMLPRAGSRFASLERRLADLDMLAIDVQVVSPSPHLYAYWADVALAEEIASLANQGIRDLVAQTSGRLVGLGMVSLQYPEQAARQVRDAMALGLKGVEISASVGPRELSDRMFDPFWSSAEQAGALVFIHPLGSSLGRRLDRFYLSNTVGQPSETAIALSHIIFGGVLDRFPRLRFLAAHGGGYLPHYIGRSDHAWRVRPDARGCAMEPSRYLGQIWYDTVLFDDVQLGHLIARVGPDRVVFGTDYPFDMADYDPGRLAASLAPPHRAAVLGGNAAALLNL